MQQGLSTFLSISKPFAIKLFSSGDAEFFASIHSPFIKRKFKFASILLSMNFVIKNSKFMLNFFIFFGIPYAVYSKIIPIPSCWHNLPKFVFNVLFSNLIKTPLSHPLILTFLLKNNSKHYQCYPHVPTTMLFVTIYSQEMENWC